MATTITTSTADYATAGGRHTGVTSAGVDWVMLYNLASTRLEFWYSSDDGATWTESTTLRFTVAANEMLSAEFYIGEHDRACFAHAGTGGAGLYYTASLTSTATWTTLLDSALSHGANAQIRCRVLDYGTIAGAALYSVVALTNRDGNLGWSVYHRRVSNDAAYTSGNGTIDSTALAGWCDFDFEHTGDGVTAITAPDLFIVYRDSDGTPYFLRKPHTLDNDGWSTIVSNPRQLDTAVGVATDAMCAVFDGARMVVALIDNDSDLLPKWFERDAADTTTTERVPTALSDGAITSLSLSFDGESDARLYAVGTTSDDAKRLTFDRSAGTFGTWVTLEAATATTGTLSVQSGYQGDGLNWVVTSGAGSPYDVVFERDAFNTAPTGATWVSPADNSAQNEAATLAVAWTFNDPDDGDTQSAYAIKRVISAVTTYYRASDSSWQVSETKNTSTTEGVTLPATWGADGESVALSVKTWDFIDTEGVYGSTLTVIGSTPVTPVITAPTDASTITTNKVTVTWTATEQTARRIRVLTSADAVLYDSGKVTTTTKTFEVPTVLSDGLTSAKAEVRVWNDDDAEGPTDTNTFTVDFVEPAISTLVVAADDVAGYISVTITEPTPAGSQPTVDSHDLYVRVADGGRQVNDRTVNDDGIRIVAGSADAVLYDYAAASGVDFEYRVLAIASSTGTSSWSAWS